MSLARIVSAVGGDLYDRGARAAIPGPGHGPQDRSVSLLLTGGRVVIHSFGRSSWREVRDELRARGLIDGEGRPEFAGGTTGRWSQPPSTEAKVAVAARLWSDAQPLERQLSLAYVRSRGVLRSAPVSGALRHHPALRAAVYARQGAERPALLAAVTRADGTLCAVEATYLDRHGRRAAEVRVSRKAIGALPHGCAVRLDAADTTLLVAEGVFTTLSASRRFGLPGWALLSTGNLRRWTPPTGVRRVLIAADRGVGGERSALELRRALVARRVSADIAWPPTPAGDWNEADVAAGKGGEGGWGCAERWDGP